jgi:hypothetical protein
MVPVLSARLGRVSEPESMWMVPELVVRQAVAREAWSTWRRPALTRELTGEAVVLVGERTAAAPGVMRRVPPGAISTRLVEVEARVPPAHSAVPWMRRVVAASSREAAVAGSESFPPAGTTNSLTPMRPEAKARLEAVARPVPPI